VSEKSTKQELPSYSVMKTLIPSSLVQAFKHNFHTHRSVL